MVYMFVGILAVAMLAVLGSIASRKLNFNYAFLAPLSFAIYTLIAYYSSKEYTLTNAIISNAFVGLFDGTIGLKLSLFFKANIHFTKEEFERLLTPAATLITVIIAIAFAFLGYFLAR